MLGKRCWYTRVSKKNLVIAPMVSSADKLFFCFVVVLLCEKPSLAIQLYLYPGKLKLAFPFFIELCGVHFLHNTLSFNG